MNIHIRRPFLRLLRPIATHECCDAPCWRKIRRAIQGPGACHQIFNAKTQEAQTRRREVEHRAAAKERKEHMGKTDFGDSSPERRSPFPSGRALLPRRPNVIQPRRSGSFVQPKEMHPTAVNPNGLTDVCLQILQRKDARNRPGILECDGKAQRRHRFPMAHTGHPKRRGAPLPAAVQTVCLASWRLCDFASKPGHSDAADKPKWVDWSWPGRIMPVKSGSREGTRHSDFCFSRQKTSNDKVSLSE